MLIMEKDWITLLKNAKKTCISQNNLRKVHYELEDGQEMVEEYNMDTEVLTRRAWRKKSKIKSNDEWDIEIGDPEPKLAENESLIIQENSNQPFITKRITKKNIEWRIRNLSYPIETYNVTADSTKNKIIVSTSNKKYYKEISIPELKRVNLLPEQSSLCISHKFNTLIITYKKPNKFLELENIIFEEVKKLVPKNDGVGDCKQS
ncbi:protein DPCD [Agrilus planipennis]|uniref:Protein DPCD n=1 Tax=Agrilus planipennis TaxID=224129 RepID=A0A1W4WHB9_AGRPL|nr:protein DPCD [Agrilus planipennis]